MGMQEHGRTYGFQPGRSGNPAGSPPGPHIGGGEEARLARKHEFVRLLLSGAKLSDIASLMGIAYGTAVTYIRDPWVREQIAELRSSLLGEMDAYLVQSTRSKMQMVDELAWKALRRMEEILDDQAAHPAVVAKMIDSALDRCPEVSRTKKLDITERKLTLSGEDLLHAVTSMKEIEDRERSRTAAREPREPINVTP